MTETYKDGSHDPSTAPRPPINSYRDLTQAEVLADLSSADKAQLGVIRSLEEAGLRRPAVLDAIATLLYPETYRAAPEVTDAPMDQLSKLMAAYTTNDTPSRSASVAVPSSTPPVTGWWLASDGLWYPPQAPPAAQSAPTYETPPWSNPPNEPRRTGGRHRAVAIVAVVAVVALVAAVVVLNRNRQPGDIATALAPPARGTAPAELPATTQPSVPATRTVQSVALTDLGGLPWTDLGREVLTPDQLAPSAPCPGQPATGWGVDLSGSDSEFSYKLQTNGNEAGHLLSLVIRTSSAEAAARRLVYRQSDTNIACLELAARDSLARPGVAIVSLSTTRVSMPSVEPAAMWRIQANLSGADGHRFVVYQDAVRIVDGPYLIVIIVNGCGCLSANPNPAAELVPGETQAIDAMGRRLHDVVGH